MAESRFEPPAIIEARFPPCPICAAPASGRHAASPYWMCPSCDCWFQSPMPPKMYEAPNERDEQGESIAHLMSEQDKEVNRVLAGALFRNWLKGTPARALDIGSGYPYLSHCLRALGCEAYGMDNFKAVPEYSRSLEVPMLMADFERISEDQIRVWTQPEKFALITMIHVFEHMYNPLEALRRIRSLISEDGTLFVRLPDHNVEGFARDLTADHYTIHPFFHSLSSILELLVHGQDLFTVRQTYPLTGSGQRDLILKPLMKKPVVYAGLIVKNEERDLPRCLRSIESVVDGVVIVDTGSIDATLNVAHKATKRPVYAQTYTEASRQDEGGDWKIWDFSKARNVFVQEIEARGADYVLWMDADDELLTAGQLRRVFYWDQYDVFGIQVESAGSRWTHHRVWKTKQGIHFQGRCHEYPTYGGHASIVLTDTVVHHHAEPGVGESSNARNMRILHEEFVEAPSSRTAFYLANTYRDARRYVEAVPWYDRRIAFGRGYLDEWLFAHLYKARCQRWARDFVEARKTLHQATAAAPGWSEFWMELAYCAYTEHDYRETIDYALRACDKPQPPTQLWRESDKYTNQPPRLISWSYEHLGDVPNALVWALRARNRIIGQDDEWDARIARLQRGEIVGDVDDESEDRDGGEGGEGEGREGGERAPAVIAPARIAICRSGAIGDILMTLNLVPLLRQKWSGHEIHYYCHPSIGSKLRDIILASGVAEVADSDQLDARRYVRVFNLVGYPLHEGYPEKPMRRHLLDYFADELGLGPSGRPSLRLALPPRLPGTRAFYATLQVKTGWSAYKNWPVERWAEVVRACPEIPIYQIGKADEPLVEGALHDFMGLELAPTIRLFANASLHLGLDSYANHLSHYLWEDGNSVRRVPAVILWGSTQVSALGYDHNTNISLGLACQPCFREDPAISCVPRGVCDNPPGQSYAVPQHACMLGISVESVVRAVKELWKTPPWSSDLNKTAIEISPGELVDRTTILRLKYERIRDPSKLAVVRMELRRHEDLLRTLTSSGALLSLIDRLSAINTRLWEVEEDIRACEQAQDFGPKFITLARAVYGANDERAATKREIDTLLGSSILEVKSYGEL